MTYRPSDMKPLLRIKPDLLEHANDNLRAWGGPCGEVDKVLMHANVARKVDSALVEAVEKLGKPELCLLYTSPSPRDS